jgi:hypothetical protein
MVVDASVTGTIERPRAVVAAYLRDPANDPEWIGGIRRRPRDAGLAAVQGDAGRFSALAGPLLGAATASLAAERGRRRRIPGQRARG